MSLTSLSTGSSGSAGEGLVISRVAPEARYEALALLLTGQRRYAEAAVDNFLAFIGEQNLSLDSLWTARRDGQSVAAALVIPCAGRTAMVFVSPVAGPAAVPATAALLRAVCAAQDARQMRLIQALLDPGQDLLARALEAAGFTRLAQLIYMQRAAERERPRLELPAELRVLAWGPEADTRARFARAILDSYRQTLDCPGLLGLRAIDDIVAGHMATGHFQPDLWLALYQGDEPAAVMLLNRLPQRRALELVYLGLAPGWRGRGLARTLVRYALALAGTHQSASVVLAVDQANPPALRLYEGLGFAPTARKQALILPLRETEPPSSGEEG